MCDDRGHARCSLGTIGTSAPARVLAIIRRLLIWQGERLPGRDDLMDPVVRCRIPAVSAWHPNLPDRSLLGGLLTHDLNSLDYFSKCNGSRNQDSALSRVLFPRIRRYTACLPAGSGNVIDL
jgi:hypothetical protein